MISADGFGADVTSWRATQRAAWGALADIERDKRQS
jgi:hypothetical protein